MQISSFEILALVREIQDLVGAYIDKVYQIGKEEILLRLRKKGMGKIHLFIAAGKILFKTGTTFDTPEKPSMFAMVLRKHLSGGKISKIYQYGFDRIVVIEIERKDSTYRLIVEIIPNGNLILVDEEWKIVMPIKEQTWAHRTIRSGEKYLFPPSKPNILEIDIDSFSNILKKSDRDLVRTLALDLGLGGIYAEEICQVSKIDKNKPAKELDSEEIDRLYKSIKKIIDTIRDGKLSPEIVREGEKNLAITPIHLKKFDGYEVVRKGSISEALEELMDEFKKLEDTGEEEKKSIERQIEQQKQAIDRLLKESEGKRKEGDLIYIHLNEINGIIDRLRKAIKEKNKEKMIREIESIEMVEGIDLDRGIVRLKIEDKTIEIDFRKSAAENAELAYELSKKFREKAERAKEALRRSRERLQEKKVVKERKRERTFWFEKYRWCITSDGNLIIGGKDAKTNERIVKKHMEEKDIYVHADIHGAPSCILKCRDIHGKEKEITEKSIEEACQFAGVYSKAWKQFGEVMVYWVYPDQVSKTPQSGEFLPRGAFVIRGKRNYYRCKMEMAIGEVEIEGTKKIMGGPVDSIKKRSTRFVVVQPGHVSREDFAKALANKLETSSDKILKVLPPGDVQIVDARGIDIGDRE